MNTTIDVMVLKGSPIKSTLPHTPAAALFSIPTALSILLHYWHGARSAGDNATFVKLDGDTGRQVPNGLFAILPSCHEG